MNSKLLVPPALSYVKHRFDLEKKKDYIKNTHSSNVIKVKLPYCIKPLANCIGGATASMVIFIDPNDLVYLSSDRLYFSDKMTATFE